MMLATVEFFVISRGMWEGKRRNQWEWKCKDVKRQIIKRRIYDICDGRISVIPGRLGCLIRSFFNEMEISKMAES